MWGDLWVMWGDPPSDCVRVSSKNSIEFGVKWLQHLNTLRDQLTVCLAGKCSILMVFTRKNRDFPASYVSLPEGTLGNILNYQQVNRRTVFHTQAAAPSENFVSALQNPMVYGLISWKIPKYLVYTPGSTNIAGWKMGAPDWVDVFPIEHRDIPASHVSLAERTWNCFVFFSKTKSTQ